jgi:hypothetical protein
VINAKASIPIDRITNHYTENEMPQYIMTYLGGNQPETPEEGQQHFGRYMAWLASLGESAISPANPLANTHTVDSQGEVTSAGTTGMSATGTSGFTIIEVESMDAALSAAKGCPFLEIGGSLEVSELMQMPGST